jgi:hypothetical protein
MEPGSARMAQFSLTTRAIRQAILANSVSSWLPEQDSNLRPID